MSVARDTVVTVRLDPGSVRVLDLLVGSGVARSRSEATARLVQIGIGASSRLLENVREAAIRARSLREEFGAPAEAAPVHGGVEVARAAVAEVRADAEARAESEERAQTEAEIETKAKAKAETGAKTEIETTSERGGAGVRDEVPLPYRKAAEAVRRIRPSAELDVFQAAAIGDEERVASLVKGEPTLVEQHDENGWTPLHLAALFDRLRTASTLLGMGADPSARSANDLNATPLHAAVYGRSHNIADLLFLYRADVNARQADGWTPLHIAAHRGDQLMVDTLLRNRADPSLRTSRGETAFDLAMRRGRPHVARRLAEAQSRRR